MNKKLSIFLCGMLLLCFMTACSDDEKEPSQPKETPKAVKEVVEVLEEVVPQASDFVEVLKKADLTGVAAEKITVFAVKNKAVTRAGVDLDSASVKRHVVVGSYKKEDLTDGQELTSVNGEKLLVSKTGEEISVNGVVITGEAISVGDSYIYIVPKVIPERTAEPILHHTTILVWKLSGDDYGADDREAFAGVKIKAFNSFRESLGDNFVTDDKGEVIITHASDTIFYQLLKEGYQMYIDWNSDGKVTDDELNEGQVILIYSSDQDQKIHCYMKEQGQPEELSLADAQAQWKSGMIAFHRQNRILSQKLIAGYAGFSYANIDTCSADYWNAAYETVDLGLRLRKAAETASANKVLWNALADTIKVDLGLVYTNVLGYYNQYLYFDEYGTTPTCDMNALIEYLDKIVAYLPSAGKGRDAVCALAARVCLNKKAYQKAYQYCKEVIDRNVCELLPQAQVFETPDNRAVVWGGYSDSISFRKGRYYHPIRYTEVLLMQSEAANELGYIAEAIAPLNRIMVAEGEPAIAPQGATKEEIREYIKDVFDMFLRDETLEYSNWRRWGMSDSQLTGHFGYQSRNSLLPIPRSVLKQYPCLKPNPGY